MQKSGLWKQCPLEVYEPPTERGSGHFPKKHFCTSFLDEAAADFGDWKASWLKGMEVFVLFFEVWRFQLMINWWFGLVVWIPGIPLWMGLLLGVESETTNLPLVEGWCWMWIAFLTTVCSTHGHQRVFLVPKMYKPYVFWLIKNKTHPQNSLRRFSTSILVTWNFWWHSSSTCSLEVEGGSEPPAMAAPSEGIFA